MDEAIEKILEISQATNIEDAAKWAENINSMQGRSIQLPDDPTAENNALIQRKMTERGYDIMMKPDVNDAEQMNAMYNALGRPSKEDGYKLPEMTDDFKYNEDEMKKFADKAHSYGFSQAQFDQMVQAQVSGGMSEQADYERLKHEGITALKTEMGYAYEEKVAKAAEVMKVANPDFDVTKASRAEIEGALRIADYYGNLGKEGTHFSRPDEVTKRTPDEAQAEIAALRKNPAYLDPQDPEHNVVRTKMRELYKSAYPDNGNSSDGVARVGGVKFTA